MPLRDNIIRRALSHYLREERRLRITFPFPEVQARLDREWFEAIAAAEDEESGAWEHLLIALDAIDYYAELGFQMEAISPSGVRGGV
jgi:hypothetical protein